MIKIRLARIAVGCMKVFYLLLKPLKVKNRVVMISREANEPSVDFLLLREALQQKNEEIEVRMLCKKIERRLFQLIGYVGEIVRQMYYMATSKVVILDTYCIAASVLRHKKSTKIVQIWHSSAAIKKFGYQTLDKESGSSMALAKAMCMHRNYDYVTAPSKATGAFFAQGFCVPDDRIRILGLPRIDHIREEDLDTREKIIKKYPIVKDKVNVLYAPTFRKGKSICIRPIIECMDFEKYNLIVKVHPLDKENLDYDKEQESILIDDTFSSFEWMKVAEKVVSDYSAIGLECTLLEKEAYFYLYDLEEYERTTGLNMDLKSEAIGRYVTDNPKVLAQLFDEKYDLHALQEFRDKYFEVSGTGCAEKMADFIDGILRGSIYEEGNNNVS